MAGAAGRPAAVPTPGRSRRSARATRRKGHPVHTHAPMPAHVAPPAPASQEAHVAPAVRRSPWRRLGILAIPLLILALAGETLWFAPLDETSAAPARNPAPLPLAAVNPFGAHVFLEREVDRFKKDKTLDLFRQANLHWVKQEFPWSELEFGKNKYYDDNNNAVSWDKFDDIVSQIEARGLDVIARLDRAPAWARPLGASSNAPPTSVSDFGDFVAAFVQHYKGRIHFLQIWNEPNLEAEWVLGKPVDPQGYVALLREAATRARAVDPDIIILSAPLAPTNEDFRQGGSNNLRETAYLDMMYDAGAAPWFDIAAANAFGYNSPPEEPPAPNTYNLRRVELLRAVMEKHHDTQKPIWITEYAWNAQPADGITVHNRAWGQVTQQQQADYTARGIEYARTHWPWSGVFVIWYFRQVGNLAPDDAEYYFGMVSPDFVTQPVYGAVQAEAADMSIAGVGDYGALSTPVNAGPGWTMHMERPEAGRDAPIVPLLVSQSPTATLTITFRGTDLDLQLAPPQAGAQAAAPRIYVTIDGATENVAANLPRDEQGRPYIGDLQSAQTAPTGAAGSHLAAPPAAQARTVAVATGLGKERAPEVHTAQLRVSGPGAAISGFTVASARSYLAFGVVTGLLLLALLADGLWLRRTRGGPGP